MNSTFKKKIISLTTYLKKNNLTISIAESCTGGLFSKILTDFPGSSNFFYGSVVVYSNESKTEILSVKKETLIKHGAVSKNTANEMISGLHKLFNTDISVSITGIAGPESDNTNKPVGLVWTGIKIKNQTKIFKNNFTGSRKIIRYKAVNNAVNKIIKILKLG